MKLSKEMHFRFWLAIQLTPFVAALGNPYTVLSVSSKADTQEIKRAYKKLVKEWHPDKNTSPDAEAKFIDISQAYELLSDPERRRLYDTTGQTEDQPNFRQRPDYSGFHRYDPFDEIFANVKGGGFKFHHFHNDDSYAFYKKQSITFKAYENSVLLKSHKQPYLLLFYSDWCSACVQVEPIWKRLVEELEPINFLFSTVHATREPELARKVGVNSVPFIVLILDARVYQYTEPSLSIVLTLDFIRHKLPHSLVRRISTDNLETFLSGWTDNKVRVLLFGKLDMVRMRYLSLAWEFRERAVFGYVQTDRSDTDAISAKYQVPVKGDTLMVFQEDLHLSVAGVTMNDLTYQSMRDVVEANKFLSLPRLSSQAVFDALCPVESSRTRRRLCVVLITQEDPSHDPARATLREFAVTEWPKDRVAFTYIYREKQSEFVNALMAGSDVPAETSLHLVILWRRDRIRLKYQWLERKWEESVGDHSQGGGGSYNASQQELKATVVRLLRPNEPMPYETEIRELFDEHAHGIWWKIISKLAAIYDYIRDNVTQDEVVPVVSVVATLLIIMAAGYVLAYFVKLEEESVAGNDLSSTGASKKRQLPVHELRGETYNGMIRLLKPGCQTVVILCNTESKATLLPQFMRACWPYRKNKVLMFGFLNVDRPAAMEWYKRLLVLGLAQERDITINPKNTVGTVVALNGYRKYYCLYHAKHPEVIDPQGGVKRRGMSGDFMGFSDDSLSDSDPETGDKRKDSVASNRPLLNYYSNVLFEDQLLEGLRNWFDRLFEGSTQRFHINYWPDWPGK